MKHEKRHVGSRILSILLAMVLTVSGMIVPVQASALPSAEENPAYEQQVSETGEPLTETGEDALQNTENAVTEEELQGSLPENQNPEDDQVSAPMEESTEAVEEKPYVYFQYDDGRTQQMDESNTFTLSAVDSGKFVLAGTDKTPEWNVSGRLDEEDGSYGTHYWVGNDGKYCPADLRVVEGSVCNADNPGEVFQQFKINNVSSNIEELKAFVGDQEVSLDKPFIMQGSSRAEVYLKARVQGSEEWKRIPVGAWSHKCTGGPGMIRNGVQGSTIMLTGEGNATFRLSMYEDRKNLNVDFKVTSNKVPVEGVQVKVPAVWYIDAWNALADYYVGITRGHGENNFNYSFTPENATNQNLIWEAKTPEIAEYMEAFGNGIVPKKAGVAKFHVYSEENPEVYQDVKIRFYYKDPLRNAQPEKEVYELEEGTNTKVKIAATPENATEQRFIWTYSQEGIVEVKSSVSMESGDVNAPKITTHTIKAQKAGVVTVTGTPMDATGGCKPVQFTVRVTKDGVVPGEGDYLKMAKEDIQHGIAYLQNQPMNKYGNEWNIFSTLRAGGAVSQENLDEYYASVSEKLKKGTKTLKATDVARVSITLAAMGKDLTDIEGVDLMKSLYNDELMTGLGKDTSNGPIWALIALDCQKAEIPDGAVWTRDKLIQQILSFQTAEGGFGLTDSKRSSIDMTGMALQALAPYRDNQQVSAAFDKAVSHLQSQMTENAGFLDAGKENSNSTAQVLTALTAAGIDPLAKENGFTNGEKNIVANLDSYKADSGFMWQQGQGANGMATQQVVYALEAYRRFAENENRLYDLTDVEIKVDESDRQAADAVIEKINAIGEPITLESKDAINTARRAYNALTEKQKKLVEADVLAKLEAAEKELKNLEDTTVVGHVVVSVERFTIGQGYIHEPVVVPFVTNDNAVSILKKVIGEKNWVGNDGDSAYLEAIVGGDLGSDKVKVPDYIAQIGGPTTEEAKEYGHSGAWDTPNTLGQFDYNNMSGWMYHVNGEEVGYGMANYEPKDGDVLRYQFTLWGYGTDLTGKEWGKPDPVIQICNKDEITRVMAQINEKQDTLKQMPAVKAAYDKAVDLVSAVITPKEEIDAATADLKELLDNNGVYTDVANVQTLINVIGEVTLDSLGKIEAAEAAYNKLSEERKAYVTNHQTLIDARAAYDRLKEETDKEQADQAAAAGVTKMIEEIGEVTLESLPKIEAAENAYAALTPDQKKYVTEETVAKLTAARAKYDQLKKEADDKAKADEVTKLIDAIGEVTLESLSKIEAAENAYAALTPDQKEYISEETVTKLTDARAAYDRLKEETDRAEADKVTKLIDAIGEVTLESLGKIEAAEKAYADLSEEQKNYVTEETVAKLTAARKAYDKLKQEADQEAADKAAADGVIKMIEEIGEVTLEKGPAIKAARAAYEALSKEQKELVGDKVLGKLEKAEEELKRLEAENQKPGEDPNKPQSVKMLVNEKYGVKLEGEGLTSDMELKVTPIGKDHADVEQMRKEIPSAKSVFRLYNIQLLKNGKEAELPSESILSIPVGTDYNGKELTVLHCINSKVEKLNGKVTDGVVQVKVSSLKSFGVVIDTPASNGNNGSGNNGNGGSNGNGGNNSGNGNRGNGTLQGTGVKTGDETPITALLLILAASAAVLGATVYKKQKRQAR